VLFRYRFRRSRRNIKIPLAFDVQIGFCKHQPWTIGFDLFRLRQAQVGIVITALLGKTGGPDR
jgi:hypothetical protein